MTNFRDSVFRRPHPLFWRFVHGVAVLYALHTLAAYPKCNNWQIRAAARVLRVPVAARHTPPAHARGRVVG